MPTIKDQGNRRAALTRKSGEKAQRNCLPVQMRSTTVHLMASKPITVVQRMI